MRWKNLAFFVLAVSVSLPAAAFRWDDSAHSIGLIKASGGEARHPVPLGGERDRCNLISTATVIPPYRGDTKVVLEGKPELDYEIFASGPVIDLGIRRLPKFRDNTLYGLEPMDRIALWVLMHPPGFDHVCGMSCGKDGIQTTYQGKSCCFCAESCRLAFEADPTRYLHKDRPSQTYSLAFYDVKTGKSVLNVPISFNGKGDQGHGGGHH